MSWVPLLERGATVFGAIGEQGERTCPRKDGHQVFEHRLAHVIEPVGVLNHVESRCDTPQRSRVEQPSQSPPAGIWVDVRLGRLRAPDTQQIVEKQKILHIATRKPIPNPLARGIGFLTRQFRRSPAVALPRRRMQCRGCGIDRILEPTTPRLAAIPRVIFANQPGLTDPRLDPTIPSWCRRYLQSRDPASRSARQGSCCRPTKNTSWRPDPAALHPNSPQKSRRNWISGAFHAYQLLFV